MKMPSHLREQVEGVIDWKGVDVTNSTAAQRFWAKVDKTGECWLWTAGLNDSRRGGYGRFRVDSSRQIAAHRFAYEEIVGPIPPGMQLDHRVTCPKRCVNPAHLRPVTSKQNNENRAGARHDSRSGVRGVFWDRASNRWRAQVVHNGVKHEVGYFLNLDEAAKAVQGRRIELFTHNDADRL